LKSPAPLSSRLKAVWTQINEIVSDNGGSVVSVPNVDPLRFECVLDSDLPEVLRLCGFTTMPAGTNTRLMPMTETVKQSGGNTTVTRQHVAPCTVAVYQLYLTPIDEDIP
jgi:hypothetical protein